MDPTLYSLHKAIKQPESVHACAFYYPPHNIVQGSTQLISRCPVQRAEKRKKKTMQPHPTSRHHETGSDNRLDNSGRPPVHRTRQTRCRFGTEIHLGRHFFLHPAPWRPTIIWLAKHIPSVWICLKQRMRVKTHAVHMAVCNAAATIFCSCSSSSVWVQWELNCHTCT